MLKHSLLPGILWGALLLLSSCAEGPAEDPHKHEDGSFKTTIVTGRFEGFDDYRSWIVYYIGPNFKSNTHWVGTDGSFQIKAVNVPVGYYRLYFGVTRSKTMGSMKIRIDSLRTHLGVIKAGQ